MWALHVSDPFLSIDAIEVLEVLVLNFSSLFFLVYQREVLQLSGYLDLLSLHVLIVYLQHFLLVLSLFLFVNYSHSINVIDF